MHISSVFFAVFDERLGRQIIYQVPENLITTPPERSRVDVPSSASSQAPLTPVTVEGGAENEGVAQTNGLKTVGSSDRVDSKSSSMSRMNAWQYSNGNTTSLSPNRPGNSGTATIPAAGLFEWQLVSQFVIPPPEMCGRLTISTTKKHRIVGFPVYIRDLDKYERGTFQFNVCFVFSKDMDYRKESGISCYEPVVRKLARILTACEVYSPFYIRL